MTANSSKCPGCDGHGRLTDSPVILKCESCGGLFTAANEFVTTQEALKVVDFQNDMTNHCPDGMFYFDLMIANPNLGIFNSSTRLHGWADRKTRRVVQWG